MHLWIKPFALCAEAASSWLSPLLMTPLCASHKVHRIQQFYQDLLQLYGRLKPSHVKTNRLSLLDSTCCITDWEFAVLLMTDEIPCTASEADGTELHWRFESAWFTVQGFSEYCVQLSENWSFCRDAKCMHMLISEICRTEHLALGHVSWEKMCMDQHSLVDKLALVPTQSSQSLAN